MKGELSDRNKAVIDRLFINGFNRSEAWREQYPETQDKYIATSIGQMLSRPNAKDYYKIKHKEFCDSLDVSKHTMIDNLLKQVDMFDTMVMLASKDNLTSLESEKLERLKDLVKGSDVMKAKDMICKLIDAYTPVKIEVQNTTFKVGFDLSDEAEIVDEI